jgi:uncharacterized membrane protein
MSIVGVVLGIFTGYKAVLGNATASQAVVDMYNSYVGELPSILYDLCEPSFAKATQFGYRILGLLVGWFVFLFVLELGVALVMFIIRLGLKTLKKNFRSSRKNSRDINSDSEDTSGTSSSS